MKQKLTLSAIIVGAIQFFLQGAHDQGLLDGRWAAMGTLAAAAVMLALNGMIHIRDLVQSEQPGPTPPVFVPVVGPDFRPAGPPSSVPPDPALQSVSSQMSSRFTERLK